MKKRLLIMLIVLTGIFLFSASIVWAEPPAPVAKTGQTLCYLDNGTETDCTGTAQDGDYQMGVASPSPRFTDNGDSTVTDNLTGLMWAKNANLGGLMTWDDAIDYALSLSLGLNGCGSSYTDWRLPNVKELQSLIDFSNASPPLPDGHPFLDVVSTHYWSSTTSETLHNYAWIVSMYSGDVAHRHKGSDYYLWPVRGGN
jgi:hypothetical protein